MESTDRFSVGVQGSEGVWPNLPQTWSYSSLREATECPRRWMLSRASYPELWNHWGYPPKPSLPALIGDVVHGALERLLRDFREHGCTSLIDPTTVAVLKNLGGYSHLAEQGIEVQLERLAANPRMSDRIGALRTAMRIKVPEIRQRVQAVIARAPLQLIGDAADGDGVPGGRGPLAPGFHPEVELRAPALRLAGRADLLTVLDEACDITDYKTGASDAHHADQVRLYALLWNRDEELNPSSLPVRRLILAYSSHDVDVEPPSDAELDKIAVDTAEQIREAEAALLKRPPVAYPEASMCGLCGVRQLCDEYWNGLSTMGVQEAEWFDFEGTVSKRNGARSWVLNATSTDSTLLLRTSSEVVPFRVGDHLRLLDLHREDDQESSLPIGTLTHASEVFTIEPTDYWQDSE